MKSLHKKNVKTTIIRLLLSIFSILFVLGASFTIYYFSKGYRFDLSNKEIRKTGVITVQSEPSYANLYIAGEELGRTPRSRTLDTGIHTVSVWKKGYREWKKDVEVLEEKTTPIFPFLLLEDIERTTLWELESAVEKYWINKYSSHFIFLTQNEDETFTLWTYRVNSPIWNLTANPIQTLTIDSDDFDLQISPNGQLAILKTDDFYIIELQKTNVLENLTPLHTPLSDEEYEISWAMDNRYVVFENEKEILSLDTSRNILYPLIEKENQEQYVWATDEESFLYTVETLHTEEDEQYIYAIKQRRLDGNNERYTIEKIYFQKDEQFIQHYRENGDNYPEFSNSPQSTQTTGQITDLNVNQSAKGVFIQTTTSSYWYSMESQKYRMIFPYSVELLRFSPNSEQLLFVNGENFHTFRFDKEEGDHTKILGSLKIDSLKKDTISELNWLSNSSHISYIEDGNLFISEDDGENREELIPTQNLLLYSIKNSREYIVTLEKEDSLEGFSLTINQYKIK